MGMTLKSAGGGTITLNPSNSTNANTISIQANSGVVLVADSNTGAVKIATGNTAQRSAAGSGLIRFNSETLRLEYSINTSWYTF